MPSAASRTRSHSAPRRRATPGFAEVLDAGALGERRGTSNTEHVPLDLVLAALPRRRGFGLSQTMPVLFQLQNYPHVEPLEAGGAPSSRSGRFRHSRRPTSRWKSATRRQAGMRLQRATQRDRGSAGRRHDRTAITRCCAWSRGPCNAVERICRVMLDRSLQDNRPAPGISRTRRHEIATALVIVGLALGIYA